MEIEHCHGAICKKNFTTAHGKSTNPMQEWNLVCVAHASTVSRIHAKRQVPDVEHLMRNSVLVRQAELKKFEIIAVILYTGPMVCYDSMIVIEYKF